MTNEQPIASGYVEANPNEKTGGIMGVVKLFIKLFDMFTNPQSFEKMGHFVEIINAQKEGGPDAVARYVKENPDAMKKTVTPTTPQPTEKYKPLVAPTPGIPTAAEAQQTLAQ